MLKHALTIIFDYQVVKNAFSVEVDVLWSNFSSLIINALVVEKFVKLTMYFFVII